MIPIPAETLTLDEAMKGELFQEINQLVQCEDKGKVLQPQKPKPDYKNLWFPTPETCDNPEQLTPKPRKIYEQLHHFQQLEQKNPKQNEADRNEFLSKFDWKNSVLTSDEISELEHLLIEFEDTFAKHRFDVGYNTEMKIKLTPKHSNAVYMQSPPTPIHLRDEMMVELALLQYYVNITTLTNSKYSSPIFAQRKPSGRLRILHDLRKINHLLRHEYANHNFPISNMTDAVNHFAGKKLFTKLDCSQAYHCVQMADSLSVQLLAFNFVSRTYAYKVLAQGLSKSVTGFSAFVRKYLDQCLAANLCTQFMDDSGSGAENFAEIKENLTKIFASIRSSGLKLSPEKCQFGMSQSSFLGNTITSEGITPETKKIEKFLDKVKIPQTVKQVKRLISFTQFFRNFIPKLNEKLLPFYKFMRRMSISEFKMTISKILSKLKLIF